MADKRTRRTFFVVQTAETLEFRFRICVGLVSGNGAFFQNSPSLLYKASWSSTFSHEICFLTDSFLKLVVHIVRIRACVKNVGLLSKGVLSSHRIGFGSEEYLSFMVTKRDTRYRRFRRSGLYHKQDQNRFSRPANYR